MDVSGTTTWLYYVKIQMLHWPYLIQSVRRLHEGVQDRPSASHLLTEAIAIAEHLHAIDVTSIGTLRRRKDIREVEVEVPGPSFPFKWAFDFASHETAQLFIWHAMFSIIVNRVIEQLLGMLGNNVDLDPTFKSSNREWSRRIWLSFDFARRGKPLRTMYFLTAPPGPLIVSFEAGNAEERTWLIEAMHDLVGYRNLEGYQIAKENVLYFGRAVTGREKFIWPTNKM